MKPFDLELAKAGHKVQTRDGMTARIVCYDVKGLAPILALIDDGDCEFEAYYDIAGRNDNSSLDLFMTLTKKEGWVNLYRNEEGEVYTKCTTTYETEEDAKSRGCNNTNYVATTKIEWEEE